MKSYISVILISALLLSSLFFALPKTEGLVPFQETRFDLNKKDENYWKREFILEISIEPRHRSLRNEKVQKAKDVIYKRLQRAGAEEVQIVNYEPSQKELENRNVFEEEETDIKKYIKVTVQTTINEIAIERLIISDGNIKLMKPKEELENLEPEEQMQLYMAENYETTEWDRTKFRNILINDLVAGDGERTYFGIFKPRFAKRGDFSNFLRENKGKEIGVLIDDFVIPIEIREETINLFAVSIGPERSEAHIQDIILNTGVIPVNNISIISTEDKEPEIYKIDHIQVTLAILISIASLLFFLYKREKEDKEKILQFAFTLLLVFSLSMTILKIWQIPVDLFLLIPAGILGTIFIKTMYTCPTESRMILIISIAIAATMTIWGTGYIPTLGSFLLAIILISFIAEILTKTYFKHIKIINR